MPRRGQPKADFLARIDRAFNTDPLVHTPDAVGTVFAMLSDGISFSEIEDVRHALPVDLRNLWLATLQAA